MPTFTTLDPNAMPLSLHRLYKYISAGHTPSVITTSPKQPHQHGRQEALPPMTPIFFKINSTRPPSCPPLIIFYSTPPNLLDSTLPTAMSLLTHMHMPFTMHVLNSAMMPKNLSHRLLPHDTQFFTTRFLTSLRS
jgi:hypothetical protein